MAGGAVNATAKSKAPSFVELPRADLPMTAHSIAWVEDPTGTKMRIELCGVDAAQIGALARSFAGGSR